ncbi:peptidoglycan recognition protein-like [Chrysoperla carnea]|uniref:peptidoglycan recognition protein-like n=1 Tax=Chrysoperla carnea TaxID=189513 RepID=UPI001D0780CE|nr:peptidoglycan recognition protein-like [Chrysoperla carnea]
MNLQSFITLLIINILLHSTRAEVCPTIRKRSEWEAAKGKTHELASIPVDYAIIGHTVTRNCFCFATCASLIKNIQDDHLYQRKWNDIAYNFLIGGNGEIYEGIGFDRVGTHTRDYNSKSIGIAFIGNFNDVPPEAKQLEALDKLLKCAVFIGALKHDYKLVGQRQLVNTLSPGTQLYNEIKLMDHWFRY